MSRITKLENLTPSEYLDREEKSPKRHEYVDGCVFAMSGVTPRHNMIAMNVLAALRSHVRGSACRVYISDIKVRVEATNSFYYPDVMVSCGDQNQTDVVVKNPVLIVEVLSRSTASTDRREKMLAYKQIPCLNEYMIVHQAKPKVELHRRKADGLWETMEYRHGTDVSIESIPVGRLNLPVADVYEDIHWKKDWRVSEDTSEDQWSDEESDEEGAVDEENEQEDDLDW